jgi:tetratricopeptide (TPR) repeat protein
VSDEAPKRRGRRGAPEGTGEDHIASSYLKRMMGDGHAAAAPAFILPEDDVEVKVGNPAMGLPKLSDLGFDARSVTDMSSVLGDNGKPGAIPSVVANPIEGDGTAFGSMLQAPETTKLPGVPEPPPEPEEITAPPRWMTDPAAALLKEGKYPQAIAAYKAFIKKNPDDNGGYLGLGAAQIANKDYNSGIPMLVRGCTKVEKPLAGLALAMALPGEHGVFLQVARQTMSLGTLSAYYCAESILAYSVKMAGTDVMAFQLADEELRELRRTIRIMKPQLLAKEMGGGGMDSVMRCLIALVVAVVLGFGGDYLWQVHERQVAQAAIQKGFSSFIEGSKLAAAARGRRIAMGGTEDPLVPWKDALDQFKQAAELNPNSFDAQYMKMLTGKRLLTLAHGDGAHIDGDINELKVQVDVAGAKAKSLDPDGKLAHAKQLEINDKLR